MFYGGPQEESLRAGTENLSGIVGFGKAAELRRAQLDTVVQQLGQLRDQFERRVLELIPEATVNGDRQSRTDNVTNLCFHGIDGQALVVRLDQQGIRCSQSSACTNQRPEPSYVLRAMGLSEQAAYSSARFSFSVFNTEAEIEVVAQAVQSIYRQLRNFADRIHNSYHAAGT